VPLWDDLDVGSTTWASGRFVVLAGAGISAVAPSDLPSWWHFNEAVLEGIRDRFLDGFPQSDADVQTGLERLELNAVGVARFSQIVYDAFAGSSWFALLTKLEGSVPNQCHDALATLAAEGKLAAIVTTNFDSLIERAFGDLGVALEVKAAGGAWPIPDLSPDSACQLVKVHGSALQADSLVDLANQKTQGLPPMLRAWLSRLFSEYPLLVAGFSGADLEFGPDYLGLEEAAALTPSPRWTTRASRDPLLRAKALVERARDGRFIVGELPQVLVELGIQVPERRTKDATPIDPRDWVSRWLTETQLSDEASAATCARLLKLTGATDTAIRIHTLLRESIAGDLAADMLRERAIGLAHALYLVGDDVIDTDLEQGQADLRLAYQLLVTALPDGVVSQLTDEARIERASNLSATLLSLAIAEIGRGEIDAAKDALRQVPDLTAELNPDKQLARQASAWLASGMIELGERRLRASLLALRRATSLARQVGNSHVAVMALENRWRASLQAGEPELAASFAIEADALRSSGKAQAPDIEAIARKMSGLDPGPVLLQRLREEVAHGGERIDEVLFSIFSVLDDQDDRGGLRAEIATTTTAELLEVNPTELAPLSTALLHLARFATTLPKDDGLLDDLPHLLSIWFGAILQEMQWPSSEATPKVHRDLRDTLVALARRWAQAGVERHREGRWHESERQFAVGAAAFFAAGEPTDAGRALLYMSDSIWRLARFEDAEPLLRWVGLNAGPALTGAVLTRKIKLIAHRAANEELPARQAADSVIRELDRVHVLGEESDISAACVTAAQVLALAGRREEGLALALEAVSLLKRDADRRLAQTVVEQLRAEGADDRD
jgi:hypothetical protein